LGRFLDGGARRYRDGFVGHDAVDFDLIEVADMFPQVSLGDDSDECSVGHYREAAKTAGFHFGFRRAEKFIRTDGDRVFRHPITDKHGILLGLRVSEFRVPSEKR
jgi:hypothetical protein